MTKKICAFCGQEFEATNGMQKFCKRVHTKQCKICGNSFVVDNSKLGSKDLPDTCSKECRNALRKSTNLKLYGGVAPASSKTVQDKMKSTNLSRYGVEHGAQSSQAKQKAKETNIERYGVEYYTQTKEYAQKAKETSQRIYGTDHPMQSEIVKLHSIETNMERYGVSNPMCSKYVKDRFIKSHMSDSSKFDSFMKFKDNPKDYIDSLNLDHKPTIYELTTLLGVNESTIGYYILQNDCKDYVAYSISVMEQQVIQFIQSLDSSIKIEYNVHNVITPYELDIYLPEYSIAIECNPTATHNSSINVFDKGPSSIYPSYHKKKTDMCEEKGIFLFHIFGPEWSHKRSIIESMIRNILCKNTSKLYARNTYVKHVNSVDTTKFLEENHRQGGTNSPIRLGLYTKDSDTLVSIMTFGKMRNTIGTGKEDLSHCWELVRFCNKNNTSVVGGASKLFSYFIKNYDVSSIRSFSDRAHTKGNLYKKLGFQYVRSSDPGYVWVDCATDISYHRTNAQKQNMQKFLHDDLIDLSKTETQIMEEHGFVKLYDSGTILWEYTKSL